MARARLTFIITWGILWISSQVPLLILFSAVGFNSMVVAIAEVGSAIFTAMMAAMMLVREDI
jgi:hypothetical protein